MPKHEPKYPKEPTAFDELVKEVDEKKLGPVVDLTDVEKEIDAYITEHNLHYVLDEGRYYFFYKGKEWIRASWYKLRRDCPLVFRESRTYLLHQQTVMSRLKKTGRVVKCARMFDVRFE